MEYVNAIKIRYDGRQNAKKHSQDNTHFREVKFFLLLRDRSLRLWTLGAFSLGLALCKKFSKKWFKEDFCP